MNRIPSRCVYCQDILKTDRVEALELLEKPYHQWTCIRCAPNSKIQGIWDGESGTSNLILADSVKDDKVEFFDDTVLDIQ